jgi:hypothetical protein
MRGSVFKTDETSWFIDAGENVYPILLEPGVGYDYLEGKDVDFELGEECEGETWSPVYAKIANSSKRSLYSDIELSIIKWNIDGTKTAGELTREILKIIDK